VFAAGTMRFLAGAGHLTIRSFFDNAAGDMRDTTFGYAKRQPESNAETRSTKEAGVTKMEGAGKSLRQEAQIFVARGTMILRRPKK
jgi:hypothetical protein